MDIRNFLDKTNQIGFRIKNKYGIPLIFSHYCEFSGFDLNLVYQNVDGDSEGFCITGGHKFVKGNSRGVDIATSKIVHKDSFGSDLTLVKIVKRNSKGVDFGINKVVCGNSRNLDFMGCGKIVYGDSEGVDIIGGYKSTHGNLKGVGITGFYNYVEGSSQGVLFTGAINYSRKVKNFLIQCGTLENVVEEIDSNNDFVLQVGLFNRVGNKKAYLLNVSGLKNVPKLFKKVIGL